MCEITDNEKLGLADVIVWRFEDGLTAITTCDGPHRVANIYCGVVKWKGFTADQCKPDLIEWINKEVSKYAVADGEDDDEDDEDDDEDAE